MRNSISKAIAVIAISVMISGEAMALASFSRACRFVWIPEVLQVNAAKFFVLLGADAGMLNLPFNSDLKRRAWILESITTDFGETKYYLFSTSTPYSGTCLPGYLCDAKNFSKNATRFSRWAAQRPSDAVLSDNALKIFFHNRGYLYSSRAGRRDIYDVASADTLVYAIHGEHWYYNPRRREIVPMGTSKAVDCNLSNWGFEQR